VIVVDASVLVTVIAERGASADASQRRLDGDEVIAPELIDLEVVDVVRRLVRGGHIAEPDARAGLIAMAQAPIERLSHAGLVRRTWELRDNLSAYDAAYVALAETFEITLVTRDARIARAPGLRCAVEVLS